jgi:hypothetical protein
MSYPVKTRGYRKPRDIAVSGGTAPDGTPYLRISAAGRHTWIPREAFTGKGSAALAKLKAAGIPLLQDEWRQCADKVANLDAYPPKPLMDQPGWNGPCHYALPDGTRFPKNDKNKPVVLFHGNSDKCAARGTIQEWRKITSFLKDQQVATFILCAGYAGPFVALADMGMNQGFELAGPGGTGKSTMQRVAAAVCGPAHNPVGCNYWITANTTINGLEGAMAEHNDMVLILEESNQFAASEGIASRAAKFNALVFALADGTAKRRFGDRQGKRSRFLFITSTNEPLADLLAGYRVAVADAAADRMLTLPLKPDRPHGIFDAVPDNWDNIGGLAKYLNDATRKTYGVGIRKLLSRLVKERTKDPEGVLARLRGYLAEFRNEVGVDGSDGSEARVADAFGLVYAAGMFALRYKAVSDNLDPLAAAKACYELNRAARKKPLSAIKQLMELSVDFDTLDIRSDELPTLTDLELDEASAVVWIRRDGRREVLLTESQLLRGITNPKRFLADPEIRRLMIAEGGRNRTKRKIARNREKERFFCFRLPEQE